MMNTTNQRVLHVLRLGDIHLVKVEENIVVCNLIGQKGLSYYRNLPPVRYEAIYEWLLRLRDLCEHYADTSKNKISIHAPMLGCGISGATQERFLQSSMKFLVSLRLLFIYTNLGVNNEVLCNMGK